MMVFISCSGSLSTKVAELLVSWLPEVIQGVRTWLYSEDMEKGSKWPDEVNKALATTVGILCVTQENKDAPWLNFEAGALSKGLLEARVCPFLIDLEQLDVKGPLSHFTPTRPNEKDVWKLITTINHADPENEVPEQRLEKAFKRVWSEFEKPFQKIRETHKGETKSPQRSVEDMVIEVLEITRAMQRSMERADRQQILFMGKLPPPPLGSLLPVAKPEPDPELLEAIRRLGIVKTSEESDEKGSAPSQS
jgi:TIR domain